MLIMLVVVLVVAYTLGGCVYGTAAVVRRIRFSAQFSKLSEAEKQGWRAAVAERGLNGSQVSSLVVSVFFLLSALVAWTGFTDFSGGGLALLGLLGLLVLPPLVVGFQARGIWKREYAFAEEAGLRARTAAMKGYYAVLIVTWLIGIIGSYIIAYYWLVSL